MSFSILHFADLHLDAAFTGSRLPATLARRCREQLRTTLRRIIDLAKERGANAVTVAGDLFERARLSPDTAVFLVSEFERLAPIPVFIAPGNHDAADAASPYQRGRWPENVNIFISNRLTERALTKDFSLWSAAHLSPSERQNFLLHFQLATQTGAGSQRFPILLLHATLVSSPVQALGNHAPVTIADIQQAGFPLALLGHYHTSQIVRDHNTVVVYPGSPEPLGFDEAGDHGVAWVQLEAGQPPQIEVLPMAELRFETVDVKVDDCAHRDQLFDKIMALQKARDFGKAFVRLRLVGNAQPSLFLDLPVITHRIQDHFAFVHLENLTRPSADLEQLAQEPTVRGAFVREILMACEREPQNQQRYMDALIYGLQAFNQEEIALR
ncbi:MAG: metallophosphoesterase [candidate division KSB1 bacterium]|nr:metallophosphoesterase [candidate division KSB1 bacterium]MDZ7301466.1 metallophosphoesterase [candidate division KSB1 bacterium]MDZ7310868.1 metallophosphoesterase [candidate division KSB1 bacterium]